MRSAFRFALPPAGTAHLKASDTCRRDLSAALFDAPVIGLNDAMEFFLRTYVDSSAPDGPPAPILVVIDSLNVFVDLLSEKRPDASLRAIVHSICKTIQATLEGAVVLITGEYGTGASSERSAVSESFMCDTEIVLTREEVPVKLSTTGQPHSEMRSFCRVAKSRTGRSQARRCCYDIVPHHGVILYDTYPGDGRLLLFQENEPQRAAVDEFIQKDVPLLFPTLNCDTFGRSRLAHVLANQRRYQNIPRRTDMCLASFDTYWVKWLVELQQRTWIWNEMRRLFGSEPGLSPRVVGKLHRHVLESQASFATSCPQDIADLDIGTLNTVESNVRDYLVSEDGQQGLFVPLPKAELRLFGERRSEVVDALKLSPYEMPDGKNYRSLPYNANVGMLVCRMDVFRRNEECLTVEAIRDELLRVQDEIRDRLRQAGLEPDRSTLATREELNELAGQLLESKHPQTWEEVVALCRLCQTQVVLETQFDDTILVTLLELVWAHGGTFCVKPDYCVANWKENERAIVAAYLLLNYMYECRVLPRDSTVEVEPFGRRYGKGASPDWMFARHWHSTLVDLLTARKPSGDDGRRPFLWEQDGADLDVIPVPSTLGVWLEAKRRGAKPQHVSCLGEWHYVVLEGTENRTLGIDLINWLVGSQAIYDWAFSGALVPTAAEFYALYGDARCFNFTDRPTTMVPDLTFSALLEEFLKGSRSRSEIFDFRHCKRELHGLLEVVRCSQSTPKKLREHVERIRTGIEALADSPLLSG